MNLQAHVQRTNVHYAPEPTKRAREFELTEIKKRKQVTCRFPLWTLRRTTQWRRWHACAQENVWRGNWDHAAGYHLVKGGCSLVVYKHPQAESIESVFEREHGRGSRKLRLQQLRKIRKKSRFQASSKNVFILRKNWTNALHNSIHLCLKNTHLKCRWPTQPWLKLHAAAEKILKAENDSIEIKAAVAFRSNLEHKTPIRIPEKLVRKASRPISKQWLTVEAMHNRLFLWNRRSQQHPKNKSQSEASPRICVDSNVAN